MDSQHNDLLERSKNLEAENIKFSKENHRAKNLKTENAKLKEEKDSPIPNIVEMTESKDNTVKVKEQQDTQDHKNKE